MITLSGETDLVSIAELSALLSGQLAGGTRELTVDASGLCFADSASIRAMTLAARTLKERGGRLVLLRPQRPVVKVLALLGADQMFTIRGSPARDFAPGRHRVVLSGGELHDEA